MNRILNVVYINFRRTIKFNIVLYWVNDFWLKEAIKYKNYNTSEYQRLKRYVNINRSEPFFPMAIFPATKFKNRDSLKQIQDIILFSV